ncbi:hypothetical protein, partial [Thalassotalea litorea]|uniref:hypothetical protein n=1 Tax=Thalassotalea litorea TaxID=2020715 RepID=UPI003736264A
MILLCILCIGSHMQGCLVTDIFGKTDAVEEIAAALSVNSTVAWRILEPYQGERLEFADETTAYAYFQQHIGLRPYADLIANELCDAQYSIAIGFSVGASVLWQYLGRSNTVNIEQAVLFYGSQIRNMPLCAPKVPTHMIQPISEPHFDINELNLKLAPFGNVTLEASKHLHGFMNRKSNNFD